MKILVAILVAYKHRKNLPNIFEKVSQWGDCICFIDENWKLDFPYIKLKSPKIPNDLSNTKSNLSGHSEKEIYKLCQLRNQVNEYAFNEGYKWLLSVDADILPPKDALDKLLISGKKYIGGWTYKKGTNNIYNVDPPIVKDEQVKEVITIGNVCLLTHRDMMKIPYSLLKKAGKNTFRTELYPNQRNYADGLQRCEDVRNKYEAVYVHSGVKCKHYE